MPFLHNKFGFGTAMGLGDTWQYVMVVHKLCFSPLLIAIHVMSAHMQNDLCGFDDS